LKARYPVLVDDRVSFFSEEHGSEHIPTFFPSRNVREARTRFKAIYLQMAYRDK
jgi:hypothetical protein